MEYRNGRSKGMAYVEYEEEAAASKALIQTDGMLIGENQISVSISNPPKRKQGDEPTPEEKKEKIAQSLGSGSVTSRSKPDSQNAGASSTTTSGARTQSTPFTFVPRSQQLMGRKKTLNLG